MVCRTNNRLTSNVPQREHATRTLKVAETISTLSESGHSGLGPITAESVRLILSQNSQEPPACDLGMTRDIVSNAIPDLDYDELPDLTDLLAAIEHGKACSHCTDITGCYRQDNSDDMKTTCITAQKLHSKRLAQQAELATALISHHDGQQHSGDIRKLRNDTRAGEGRGWSN
jgi:hypothetical protein